MHQALHLPLSASAYATVSGKDLRLPDGRFRAITLPAITSQLEARFPAAASVTTVRLVTYRGQLAYALSNPKGQVLFVGRPVPHHALGIVDPSQGSVQFSKWNAVPPIEPPAPSEVVHR